MTVHLGRLQDSPYEYLQEPRAQNTLPLWPSLRGVLPYGRPSRSTEPAHWPTWTSGHNCFAPAS